MIIRALRIECLIGSETNHGVVASKRRHGVIQAIFAVRVGYVRRPDTASAGNLLEGPCRNAGENVTAESPLLQIGGAELRHVLAIELIGRKDVPAAALADNGRIM